VHHLGYAFHADACAPGILALLEPVRGKHGLVLELGCGSGALTRHLVAAGHRVIATDASTAMLDLVRANVAGTEDVRVVALPDDPIPSCDAIVSTGHALSYVRDEEALERSLAAAAHALRPGGVLALDLCDLRWAEVRRDQRNYGDVGEDWAIVTRYEVPTPARFVRQITTFVRADDGSWRRSDERHDNVLIDTSTVPALLAGHGLDAEVRPSFGDETLPDGLVAVIGRRH
jgi:SAM-dependent methyltransferase